MRLVRFPGGAVGEIPDPPEPRPSKRIYCDACEGTGNGAIHGVDGTCSACDGDGYVPAPLPEEPPPFMADHLKEPDGDAGNELWPGEPTAAEEPQDFAEEMRARSWKQWVDAHPAEEPQELKEALDAVQRTAQALLGHNTVLIVHDMPERARANDAARAALLALYDRQRKETNKLLNALIDCGVNAGGYGLEDSIAVEVPKAVASLSSQLEAKKDPSQ